MESDTHRHERAARSPMLVAGTVTAVVGLFGLGIVGYWYATDVGWTGTGAQLTDAREQARAAMLLPGAAVLFGLVTASVRRHVPLRSRGGVLMLVTNLLVVAGAFVAVSAYPQVRPAELIAHTSVGWSTALPVTEVWGVRAETDTTITLEGRADRRGCDPHSRSVTLDLSTGRILAVETLPTAYDSAADIPPDPAPIDLERFEVQQGSAPFICQR